MDESTRLHYLEVMGIESWHAKTPLEKNSPPIDTEYKQAFTAPTKLGTNTTERSDNWEQVTWEVSGCQKCELHKTRTQTVFGTGNPDADWFFIGEAPGENEDLQGKPFVGQAGLLLTDMIRALGLKREHVFISNILKCRPPNNRDPNINEITTCHDYLKRQQQLIKPKIMIAVGRIAAQKLLKTSEPLAKLRGIVHKIDGIPLVVVYHPAYLLRSLSQKHAAWQDLQLALKTYQLL